MRNVGIHNEGPGDVTNYGDVTGNKTVNYFGAPAPAKQGPAGEPEGSGVDVGIIAILDDEMRAVVDLLQQYRRYESNRLPDGGQAHEARVNVSGGELRVAALQALAQGQLSAGVTVERLRKYFRPRVVLVVGIAGGVGDDVCVGDVVIGDEVIYYDARRETDEGPRRRGQTHKMSPYILHRVHDYFVRYGDSIEVGPGSTVRVFRGPIGSGDAVITSPASEIVDWLRRFNEKVLAIDTEASGIGEAIHESVGGDRSFDGWLTIRGITDKANAHDWHERRYDATWHAALVVDRLFPLLAPRR
jgi:adenosylhomocysteine nucleosidase